MANAKEFALWFLDQIPSFLTSEPIFAFLGLMFLSFTIKLFKDLINL